MAVQKTYTTDEDFERLIALPENADLRFEFIDGEIIEVPSNAFSSELAILIAAALLTFVRSLKLGRVTGEGQDTLSPDANSRRTWPLFPPLGRISLPVKAITQLPPI
ncbi:MAG: Uma2 family endonuclease [Chloroflexota bacterium]